jgi:membrane fusion protein, multidrug efflux system
MSLRARSIVLVCAALLTAMACRRDGPEPPRVDTPVARGIRAETVSLEPVSEAIEVVGTVRSRTQSLVASKVQGYVREVRAREGDVVEKGSVLVLVDAREPGAQVDRAQAAVAEALMGQDEVARLLEEAAASLRSAEADAVYAEATATRYRQLFDRELISAHDWEGTDAKRKSAAAAVEQGKSRIQALRARQDQMRHRIAQARAELEAARITLGDTRVLAPETAVVVERRVEPGNMAMPGQTLLVLDDARRYRLEAEVGESAMGWVRPGQAAAVTLDSLGRTLEGRVAEVIPAADPASRSVTVKLDLPAVPGLRSGLFGRARFAAGERQALLIPATAVIERGQLTQVYVVDDGGTARLRLITAGRRRGDRVEALSGLAAGERVVSAGVERVSDGGRVEIAP